ncbi:LLM class flavin-dependent oxidoreductase [Nocardia beijingensis]
MKIGAVILPEDSWRTAAEKWCRADELGFDSAWTYDHLSWRQLATEPWYATFPTLAAAASVTNRIRLGTMVTTPNFRHPVLTAKEAMTIDSISEGRFILGIGSGSADSGDAELFPDTTLTLREKSRRFAEFVPLLDQLLRNRVTSYRGDFYHVSEAPMVPGCVQQPRIPFVVAASGRRAMRLAAAYGAGWSTVGTADWSRTHSLEECVTVLKHELALLAHECAKTGRDFTEIDRIFMPSPVSCENPLTSVDTFLRTCEAVAAAGITHMLVHWPRERGPYAADPAIPRKLSGRPFELAHDM